MDAITTTVELSLEAAEEKVRAALGDQGFGVLTEIDVAATLRAKLGVEREPLKILGACNPQFAHRALEAKPEVSLLLPCNVTLEAVPQGTKVSAIDPMELLDDDDLRGVATDARARLQAAIDAVAAG
jgi:uncharacterized protein (DUF302 family)